MIAYLIFLGTYIFGDTVFGIRIMAVLFSFLSSILLYALGRRVYDERVGLFSAIFIQIIPLFSAYGTLFTIDSPFIFFWILSLFLFREAINNKKSIIRGQEASLLLNSDNPPIPPAEKVGFDAARHERGRDFSMVYWRLLGLSIGFGLLTKYTMVLFYLCALLFFLFSKERRAILLTRGPYIAFIISILVFSPVIIWNANHDWVTLRHTAGQAHVAEGIRVSLQSFLEFSGSQLGVITPLFFILMAISVWKLRKKPEGDFLFWFSIPVFVFFLLKSIQAKVQANWALSGYISGIIAFSAFYMKDFPREGKGRKVLIVSAVLLTVLITSVAHYPSMLNLHAKLDPSSRITGWRELGAEVTGLYEEMSADHRVFIFSDRYQVASELAFYVKGKPVTYCVNLKRRMNQYDLWPGFHNLLQYHAIFVRTGDVGVPERIADAFQKVEKKVFTAYTKKREKIRDYSIFLCYAFKGLKEERPASY
jgi:undecaprenyl-diphosphatase